MTVTKYDSFCRLDKHSQMGGQLVLMARNDGKSMDIVEGTISGFEVFTDGRNCRNKEMFWLLYQCLLCRGKPTC